MKMITQTVDVELFLRIKKMKVRTDLKKKRSPLSSRPAIGSMLFQ